MGGIGSGLWFDFEVVVLGLFCKHLFSKYKPVIQCQVSVLSRGWEGTATCLFP